MRFKIIRKDLMDMGHTPYGYKIVNGRAVIDRGGAAVKKLYEGYLGGLGLQAAADEAEKD